MKLKKILAAVLSFSMVMVLASCNESTTEESSTATEVTTVATEEVTTVAEESSAAETEAAVAVTEAAESTIDKSKLVYDFAGLDSEEVMKVFSSGKYYLKYSIPMYGMEQSLYFDNGQILVSASMSGMESTSLIKDGKQYMLMDDMYYQLPESEVQDGASEDMFAGFGYIESGTTDVEGTTYKYDEFYQESTDSRTKFLLTDDNKLWGFESDGVVMQIVEYSGDFDTEAKIAFPEGASEVAEDVFMEAFMAKMYGTDDTATEDGATENSEAEVTTESNTEE